MRRNLLYILPAIALLCLMLYSCATIGNPEGGARDEDPPRFVRSNPPLGATDISTRKVEIFFDELVNVKDAFKNVVVSPVGKQTPRVSTSGRKVTVNFQDTLLPNTTYTIDFGNSIEDVNEANKMQGFAYWFSTGPTVDSLRISGTVLDAMNLEPQQGMLVGVHLNDADSAFRKIPLLRVARTDDYGRFVLRNLAPGQYRLFALGDLNNDYMWDNPEESIAFYGELISPTVESAYATDTIFNLKTGAVDTIVRRQRSRYLPNNILLSTFKTDFKPRYLSNKERPDSSTIRLLFGFRADSLPELRLTDHPDARDWYVMGRSATNDTIDLWLKPEYSAIDTLRMSVRYARTTFDKPDEIVTDTITLTKPKIKAPKTRKAFKTRDGRDSVPPVAPTFLDIKVIGGAHHVYDPLTFTVSEPLVTLRPEAFRLQQKQDTLWTDIPGPLNLRADTLNPLRYTISHPWEYGTEYRLGIDSIAAVGMYIHHNRPVNATFNIRTQEDYGNLYLTLSGLPDSIPCIVQLLNSSDKEVRSVPVQGNTATFNDVDPGTYFARLIADRNANGKWDTGDYLTLTQPEDVYYYPAKLKVRKNWDLEQSWNINSNPVDRQKPEEIKKNRPPTPKNAGKKKKTGTTEDDEDDTFDVNRNPFDTSPSRNKSNSGARRPSMTM